MVNNPAPAGFATKIRQNPAPAGFGKSKSGTTLVETQHILCTVVCSSWIFPIIHHADILFRSAKEEWLNQFAQTLCQIVSELLLANSCILLSALSTWTPTDTVLSEFPLKSQDKNSELFRTWDSEKQHVFLYHFGLRLMNLTVKQDNAKLHTMWLVCP